MRRWRAVRVSNPSHRLDKATASPDASQRVELVRLARLERALYGFSNRSLCHWGTDAKLVDTPGNDPGPDRLRAGRSAH